MNMKRGFDSFVDNADRLGKASRSLWAIPFVMAAAGGIKEGLVDPVVQKYRTGKSYEKMFNKYPALKESDEERVKDYFGVVKSFSPKAASNPIVAGALVKKMMDFGGVDHKLVQDLISMNKDSVPRSSMVGRMMETAAATIGSAPKEVAEG